MSESPGLSWLSLALGACLVTLINAPALRAPFFSDDHAILQVLEGVPLPAMAARNRLDLFHFFSSDTEETRRRMAIGALPWRTQTDQQVEHVRPLASALFWLDYEAFGAEPLGAHLHSLLWLIMMVCSVGLLYRRVLPGSTGIVALLLFAVSPFAVMTVAWWSCRSHLVAGVTGMAGLLAHLRWREERWAAGRALAPLLFALAFAAGEGSMQVLAFLLAYAWLGDTSPWRSRVTSVIPVGITVVAYLAVRTALGAGVRNNAFYADPVREWRAFLASTVAHAPDVLVQMLTTVPGKQWHLFTGVSGAVPAVAVALVLLAIWRRSLRRELSRAQWIALRWLLCGTAVSLLPCFTSRNFVRPWTLLIPATGACALIAVTLVHVWSVARRRGSEPPRIRIAYSLAGALLLLWAIAPVTQSLLVPGKLVRPLVDESRAYAALPPLAPAVTTVIVVRSVSGGYSFIRALFGERVNETGHLREAWILSDGPKLRAGLEVQRIAPAALELAAASGSLIPENDFFRGRERQLRAGERIDLGKLRVEIVEVEDGAVRRAQFWFDRQLDDPSLAILYFDGKTLQPLQLPEPGGRIELPAAP